MTTPRQLDVVFVHGLFATVRVWDPFIELLRDDPGLNGFVTPRAFSYSSPFLRFRPDRRIADIDDIADQFGTYLRTELRDARAIVLVTHSQGGIVVQRFLARMLGLGRGRELARIKWIVMYACPNSGSQFLLSIRRVAKFWRNPQERQLRPFVRAVTEAQEAVLRAVVNARGCSDVECRIPIVTCGGTSDRIVPPSVANWVFPLRETVEGDHKSIVRPTSRTSGSYRVLEAELHAAARSGDESRTPAVESSSDRQGRVSVLPPFGRRRDHPLRGRASMIASIMAEQRSSVHVLAGLGGTGKSRLALEIAFLMKQGRRRVWWVSVPRINLGMQEVARQLGASDSEVDTAWTATRDPAEFVWRLLNASAEPWLLVFDNADEPQKLSSPDAAVSDGTGWLREPANDNGMVIVTSRDSQQDTWGTWLVLHRVPRLAVDDGATMLMDLVGLDGGTYGQSRLLSDELGSLPLALCNAADYLNTVIRAKVWTGQGSIRDFDGYRAALRRRRESPNGGAGPDLAPGMEVFPEVFGLSLELLARRGLAEAGPLLRLFACFNIAPIPYHVLLADRVLAESTLFTDFPAARRTAVLTGLTELGLVETHVLENVESPDLANVLSLHPVVHLVMSRERDVRLRHTDYYELAIRMLTAATADADPDYPESWAAWAIIAPHSVKVATAALFEARNAADRQMIACALELARITSRYLIVTGLLDPAHDLIVPIIEGCATWGFHRDDREILGLRHEKGRIYLERGQPADAEAVLREVIADRTRVLGEYDKDTLASGHKLAKAILEQGRWPEAEHQLRKVVDAENRVRGPEHPDTLVVRHSLARAVFALGRDAEAEAMLREILAVRNRIASPSTPETLYVRQTLARTLVKQGHSIEGEDEIRDALRIGAHRADAPEMLALRYTLSVAMVEQGRISEAVDELERLLIDRQRVLGITHPLTRRTSEYLTKVRQILDQPCDDGAGGLR